MTNHLTQAERRLLEFIDRRIAANAGIVPSYEQMARGVGLKSKGRVAAIVAALERKGAVRRNPAKRSLELTEPPGSFIALPRDLRSQIVAISRKTSTSFNNVVVGLIQAGLKAPASAYATPRSAGALRSQLSGIGALPKPPTPACEFSPNKVESA